MDGGGGFPHKKGKGNYGLSLSSHHGNGGSYNGVKFGTTEDMDRDSFTMM